MYFEFDDYRPDIAPVGRAISWREGVLISIILHMGLVIFILVAPRLLPARAAVAPPIDLAQAQTESPRFVFMQPRVDTPAPVPPPRAPLSDQDRQAQAPQVAERPTNPLPFARGNSPEKIDAPPPAPAEVGRGQGPQSEPPAGKPDGQAADNQAQEPRPGSEAPSGLRLPPAFTRGFDGGAPLVGGALGNALQNLQEYIEQQSFDNPTGGASRPGASIQFDSKGVDFGPWLRRFVAQIRRNWFIPYAVMSAHGHTVVTFYVHRDGSITDLQVPGPSGVEAFNTAAVGALSSSNPTTPLPPAYPDDQVLFTVTFYYNEKAPE
jgi:TonB family protein